MASFLSPPTAVSEKTVSEKNLQQWIIRAGVSNYLGKFVMDFKSILFMIAPI